MRIINIKKMDHVSFCKKYETIEKLKYPWEPDIYKVMIPSGVIVSYITINGEEFIMPCEDIT